MNIEISQLKFLSQRSLTIGLLFFVFVNTSKTQAQDSAIVHSYGAQHFEDGRQVIESLDSGFLSIGTTGSDSLNNTNFYLIKLDANMVCVWNSEFGSANVDKGFSVIEDSEGNLFACGYTNGFGALGYDGILYKLDSNGHEIWHRTYGGMDWDFLHKVVSDNAGGYWLLGRTYSFGNGASDSYLIHVDQDGNIIGQLTYGFEGEDEFKDALQIDNNLLIIESIETNGILSSRLLSLSPDGVIENELVSADSIVWNTLEVFGNEIYLGGYIIGESHKNMYLQVLHASDWSVFFTNVDDLGGDFEVNDLVVEEDITMIGNVSSVGQGMNDVIVQQRSIYGVWEVASTFGGGFDDFGYGIIKTSGGKMLFVGERQFETGSDMMVVEWSAENLNFDYTLTYQYDDCFDLEVTEIDSAAPNFIYDYSQGKVNISARNEIFEMSIYDMNGKELTRKSGIFNSEIVDVNSFSQGFYLVKVIVNGNDYLWKFII